MNVPYDTQPHLPLLLLSAAVLGLLPAFIAKKKGRSFVGYWAFGFLMFIVALPYVLLMKKHDQGDSTSNERVP